MSETASKCVNIERKCGHQEDVRIVPGGTVVEQRATARKKLCAPCRERERAAWRVERERAIAESIRDDGWTREQAVYEYDSVHPDPTR